MFFRKKIKNLELKVDLLNTMINSLSIQFLQKANNLDSDLQETIKALEEKIKSDREINKTNKYIWFSPSWGIRNGGELLTGSQGRCFLAKEGYRYTMTSKSGDELWVK